MDDEEVVNEMSSAIRAHLLGDRRRTARPRYQLEGCFDPDVVVTRLQFVPVTMKQETQTEESTNTKGNHNSKTRLVTLSTEQSCIDYLFASMRHGRRIPFFSFGCTAMEAEYSIPYMQEGVHQHAFHMQDVSVAALSSLCISNSMGKC
jgi:hypothetical protein